MKSLFGASPSTTESTENLVSHDDEIQEMRRRARKDVLDGAVIPGYAGDRERVLKLLDEALATELVCVLRYKQHAEAAEGIHAESVIKEFKEHAVEEQQHADTIAKRISELNGHPDYNPNTLTERSHTEYIECSNLDDMIRENLIAERIAIESYGRVIREIGNSDPTTRRILEDILAKEEQHADEMARLLKAQTRH